MQVVSKVTGHGQKIYTIATMILVLAIVIWGAGNHVDAFAGGDGSPGNPYQVASWSDLNDVRNNLTASYVLVADLDQSSAGYATYASASANSNSGWLPIGDSSTRFQGVFDGGGHTIADLHIDRPGTSYIGLFGATNGTFTLSNLTLKDPDINGSSQVGGLVGQNQGTITGVRVDNPTILATSNAGGIVGQSSGSITLSSVKNGTVTSMGAWGGGIVGIQSGGTISRSWASTAVAANNDAGGLVGHGSGGSVNNSYSTGSVTSYNTSSENSFGGLAGVIGNTTNAYATGDVTIPGTGPNSGGLYGEGGAVVTNTFATGTVTGTAPIGGYAGNNGSTNTNSYSVFGTPVGTGNTAGISDVADATVFMGADHAHAVYSAWDFDTIWEAHDGGLPTLRGNEDIEPLEVAELNPTDDSIIYTVDGELSVVFNQNATVVSGNITIYDASDDSVVEVIDVTSEQVSGGGTSTITISPSEDLGLYKSYYIHIDSGAFQSDDEVAFGGIADETTWNFSTSDSSLIGHWKLDEGSGATAIDSSGYGEHGTVTNTSYSTQVPDSIEFDNPYSAYFNPSSSGRIVSTPLSLNNLTEFTMAGWIYPTATSDRMSLFGQNDIFEFGFGNSSTIICYTPKGEVSWGFETGFLNSWHHITCLATSSQLIMYVDGQNVASTNINAGSFGASGDVFSIGAGSMDGGTQGPFSGYIDDVRVYSRGLSESEMGSLGTGSNDPNIPTFPVVSIISPDGAEQNWSSVIDWADSFLCEYKFDNGSWQAADCAQNGADIISPGGEAEYTLYIRGSYEDSDKYGTDEIVFSLDMTAPTVDAGDNRQTNASFSQSTATADDGVSGIDTYAWSKQSGPGTVTFDTADVLNPTVAAVSQDGAYVLRLTVTDEAGNSAHDDFTLLWDTTNPEISLTDFPDMITNQTTASFSFEATDALSSPVTYTCKIDAESFNACTSPKQYTGLSEGSHSVTVRAIDGVGNSVETDVYAWTVDLTEPVITRQGDETVTVIQGQSYSDEGAEATDSHDGDITEDIVITGLPNTAAVGTYVVRYNVADDAGNVAEEQTRTVTVVSNADKNNDGIADAVQTNVANFTNIVSSEVAVLEVDDTCAVDDALTKAESVNTEQDPDYDYPAGLFNFTVSCGTPGYTTTIKQYYYGAHLSDAILRKYNPNTAQYFTISDAIISLTTIDGVPVTTAIYQVTDGGELDMDGEENGVIVDPAGLAQEVVDAPNTGLVREGISYYAAMVVGLILGITGMLLVVRQKIQKR